MKQALVVDLPGDAVTATMMLNRFYEDFWRVVGTFQSGGNAFVIMERDLSGPRKTEPG